MANLGTHLKDLHFFLEIQKTVDSGDGKHNSKEG